VQHGHDGLQAVSELLAQARLSVAIQGISVIRAMTPLSMNDINDMNHMKGMKDMKRSFIYGMTIVASIVMFLVAQLAAQGTAAPTPCASAPEQAASTAKPQSGKPVTPPP